jgi:hypothetical protein
VRLTGGQIGAEPGMYASHDPSVALGDDQAGSVKMWLADNLRIEFVPAQRASRGTRGNGPVPERGQGRRITVAERAKVRHR